MIEIEEFRATVRRWLGEHAELRRSEDSASTWGYGSDDVSVFHDLGAADEQRLLERAMEWQRTKFEAGYGALRWSVVDGGAGLDDLHEQIFREEEERFHVASSHELLRVTVNLVAPTIRDVGTDEQRRRFMRRFLAADELCCQLFSEPGAGSDLASVTTRAIRDGDDWVLDGSKVWSSGARFAQWGELLARTDTTVPKHAGLTMFLVPIDAPGIDVRPIRQMSGGASFSEVFFTGVRVPDALRLGDVGSGWKVALTTLGFERGQSGAKRGVGGSWQQVLALARWVGADADPVIRQALARLYTDEQVRMLTRRRTEHAARARGTLGPEGSVGKLLWTTGLTAISDVVSTLLGPRLLADTGEWGTYAWTAHVLGAPGYRIAGGSDEIQRNIIAERVLGLPTEPRPDRETPWQDRPR